MAAVDEPPRVEEKKANCEEWAETDIETQEDELTKNEATELCVAGTNDIINTTMEETLSEMLEGLALSMGAVLLVNVKSLCDIHKMMRRTHCDH